MNVRIYRKIKYRKKKTGKKLNIIMKDENSNRE